MKTSHWRGGHGERRNREYDQIRRALQRHT